MRIILNGQSREHQENTLLSLIQSIEADSRRIAIMVNDHIVKKDEAGNVKLKDGDRVEIVTMTNGG